MLLETFGIMWKRNLTTYETQILLFLVIMWKCYTWRFGFYFLLFVSGFLPPHTIRLFSLEYFLQQNCRNAEWWDLFFVCCANNNNIFEVTSEGDTKPGQKNKTIFIILKWGKKKMFLICNLNESPLYTCFFISKLGCPWGIFTQAASKNDEHYYFVTFPTSISVTGY